MIIDHLFIENPSVFKNFRVKIIDTKNIFSIDCRIEYYDCQFLLKIWVARVI